MLWDIDSLREKWTKRGVDPEFVINYGPGEEAVADFSPALGSYNSLSPSAPHSHS
jgi:hypothetical protein